MCIFLYEQMKSANDINKSCRDVRDENWFLFESMGLIRVVKKMPRNYLNNIDKISNGVLELETSNSLGSLKIHEAREKRKKKTQQLNELWKASERSAWHSNSFRM